MEPFIYIVALLLLGMALRLGNAPAGFAQSLNYFILYVSVPSTVVLQIPKINFDASLLLVAIMAWLLLIPSVAFALWLSRRESPQVRAALLLLLPLGNTSFLGIPILQALRGDAAIPYVLLYDQFGSFLLLSLYGAAVVARYESGALHPRLILQKMLLFPPMLALLFALFYGSLDAPLQPYIERLSQTLIPLALISVGFSLRFGEGVPWRLFAQASAFKLTLLPLLSLLIVLPFDLPPLVRDTVILEAAMPPMITAGALAVASGFAPALSAALVGYGLLLSLLSLPLIGWLLAYM
ncbi:MAG: AEC family transporter [Campylobacterales bacterium]|nr:AEC family transporter [Campylobacterales bacterium]